MLETPQRENRFLLKWFYKPKLRILNKYLDMI